MIRRFVFNPVQVNCYVLADEEAGEAAVVDCGATSVEELAPLMQYLTEAKLKPVMPFFMNLRGSARVCLKRI